jgi:hypothetical protein
MKPEIGKSSMLTQNDSGFNSIYLNDTFNFRKLNTSSTYFDSLFKKNQQVKDTNMKRLPEDQQTIEWKIPKILLKKAKSRRSKTISQNSVVKFMRIYTDTIYGERHTLIQKIQGQMDSISDSFYYIRSNYFSCSNGYLLNPKGLDCDYEQTEIGISWYSHSTDTTFKMPKEELHYLSTFKTSPKVVLAFAGAANLLATTFYSIDYTDYTVNKLLFRASLYISLASIVAGITELIIFPINRTYVLKENQKRQWHIIGLKAI